MERKSEGRRKEGLFWDVIEFLTVTSWTVITWGGFAVYACLADPEDGLLLYVVCTLGGGIPLMVSGVLLEDWYLGVEYKLIWWLRRKRVQKHMDKLSIGSRYHMPAYDVTQRIMQHGFNKKRVEDVRRVRP